MKTAMGSSSRGAESAVLMSVNRQWSLPWKGSCPQVGFHNSPRPCRAGNPTLFQLSRVNRVSFMVVGSVLLHKLWNILSVWNIAVNPLHDVRKSARKVCRLPFPANMLLIAHQGRSMLFVRIVVQAPCSDYPSDPQAQLSAAGENGITVASPENDTGSIHPMRRMSSNEGVDMLRQFSITSRIFFLLGLIMTFVIGIMATFYFNITKIKDLAVKETQNANFEGQKNRIRLGVHTLAVALGERLKEISDPQERIAMMRKTVEPIRFEEDRSGYYYIFEGTVNVVHPPLPELQGKDMNDLRDVNGIYYVRELSARAHEGGGFVEYSFHKPQMGDQPKLGYAEVIPDTTYWIGTGVYLDNVERERERIESAITREVRRNMITILTVFAVAFTILLFLCLAMVQSIILPIREATEAADRLAGGDLNVTLNASGKDEAARMQSALNIMVRTLRQDIEEIQAKTQEAEKEARAAEEALEQLEKTRHESMLQTAKHIESMRKLSMAVAHQLRNPATVIGGLAHLMLKKPETKEKHCEYLEGIIGAAERIEKIIQVVKAHNSIRLEEIREVDLYALVREVQDLADQKAAEMSKRIDWTLKIEPLRLKLDPRLMIQAMSEIVFNALESFKGESGSISVVASQRNGFLVMEFMDNGRGIPKSDLPYVFDPFFTTKAVGVGAGLALVNRIVQEHDGLVTVESELLTGTSVKIQLPLTRRD